jgi:hypothetical protein
VPPASRRTADGVASPAVDAGVISAFGHPGSGAAEFIGAVARACITFVLPRHETQAAFTAAGGGRDHWHARHVHLDPETPPDQLGDWACQRFTGTRSADQVDGRHRSWSGERDHTSGPTAAPVVPTRREEVPLGHCDDTCKRDSFRHGLLECAAPRTGAFESDL